MGNSTISLALILEVRVRLYRPATVSSLSEGVGRSTPAVARFPTPLAAALWGENSLPLTLPPLSIPGNIGLTLAKGAVTNAIYGQTGASYLPFINTPFTAQDMLQIVKAHGFEKINYYGVSYGTVLGTQLSHAGLSPYLLYTQALFLRPCFPTRSSA
jgi:pimeloyl-ACP methyl ester carboxylesterase